MTSEPEPEAIARRPSPVRSAGLHGQTDAGIVGGRGPFPSRPSVRLAAAALILIQAAMIGHGLSRNAVTFDEVCHLPAGLSYWHFRTFWCYHHNPPLIRLLTAVPAFLANVPSDYRNFHYVPHSRNADDELGKDFMFANKADYMRVYASCRSVSLLLCALGGLFVFCWSRELFGDAGGLISLSLWTFCPNILAHGGLVTPDLGGTVLAFAATYAFWRYLTAPSVIGAAVSGVLLGLAEASKFTFIILPAIWAALAASNWYRGGRTGARLRWRRGAYHATILSLVALVTLNNAYLGEGTGRPLGSFNFRSKLLTTPAITPDSRPDTHPPRYNRFTGSWLDSFPVPLPEHYVLGFDDQAYDVDSSHFVKYLRGEVRRERGGWWYYYVYCLLVKTPVGTLALGVTAMGAFVLGRGFRGGLVNELAVHVPPLAILGLVSSQTGLNSHLRYVLPVLPFVFVSVGRLGRWAARLGHVWVTACLLATAASTVTLHPNYLAYFNEVAGGPDNGLSHLADSNIDWGQGLIALQDWLERHGRGRPLRLAYFGRMYPEILDIRYKLPPFGPTAASADDTGPTGAGDVGPVPGLQAVSANFLLGCIPIGAPNGEGSLTAVHTNSYIYYRMFLPVAVVAHSIYVYDLGRMEVDRVRKDMGLPPYAGDKAVDHLGVIRSEGQPDGDGRGVDGIPSRLSD